MLKKETEELLLSITKNFATLIEPTQTKPQETQEFNGIHNYFVEGSQRLCMATTVIFSQFNQDLMIIL